MNNATLTQAFDEAEDGVSKNKYKDERVNFSDPKEALYAANKASSEFIWGIRSLTLAEKDTKFEGNIKFSLASFNFSSDSKSNSFPYARLPLHNSKYRIVAKKPDFDQSQFFDSASNLMQKMHEQGSNYLCLPEFSFIFPQKNEKTGEYKKYLDLIFDYLDMPDGHDMVVIPGSGHCPVRTRNLAPILARGHKEIAREMLADQWQEPEIPQDGATAETHEYMMYCKRRPAYKLREKVSPPLMHTFPIFETTFGKIAVLICLDAADMSIISSLISYNQVKRKQGMNGKNMIKYIFIPSFNGNHLISNMSKAITMLTGAICLHVNWDSFKNNIDTRNLYFAGKSYEEWKNSEPGSPEINTLIEFANNIKVTEEAHMPQSEYGWTSTTYEVPSSLFGGIMSHYYSQPEPDGKNISPYGDSGIIEEETERG